MNTEQNVPMENQDVPVGDPTVGNVAPVQENENAGQSPDDLPAATDIEGDGLPATHEGDEEPAEEDDADDENAGE